MSVVFMGTPDISVPFLETLHNFGEEIIIFTQPDRVRGRGKKVTPSPVKQRAKELNIPTFDCSIKSLEALNIIRDFSPELMIVVAYGQIVPVRILEIPTIAPINIHFSLLPRFRGATPVQGALLAGDEKSGTTLQFMDRGLDTGDIIYQEGVAIEKNDNATRLFEKLIALSLHLLNSHWQSLKKGSFTRTPQNDKEASYTRLITKSDLKIEWTRSADEIIKQIRAYTDEPGVKALFRNKPIFITQASLHHAESSKPGEIIAVDKQNLTVACGSGALHLEQVKPAGKKPMDIRSFINGYHPTVGDIWQ